MKAAANNSDQDETTNYEQLREKCRREKKLYEDPDFPATIESISVNKLPDDFNVEWKRPAEIAKNPQMFVSGASRLDIMQGELGDCWFLSAISTLTQHPSLFERVVPTGQGFTDKTSYAGVFHFNFWCDGEWQEVIIDDRLPIVNGKYFGVSAKETNEFWPPLLEKAYAKMYGRYMNLHGGTLNESLVDLTGGVFESFKLGDDADDDLYSMMVKSARKQSLMTAAIYNKPGVDAKQPNGLLRGHAYSVTGFATIRLESVKADGDFHLIRLRNPYGTEDEWNGAWSDRSDEWDLLTKAQANRLRKIKGDGEYWMSFDDFCTEYTMFDVCSLGAAQMTNMKVKFFHRVSYDGYWEQNINAGGARKNTDTYCLNPQYRVTVSDSDDDDELATLVVALLQKRKRVSLYGEGVLLYVGYCVYKLKNPHSGRLGADFFAANKPVAEVSNTLALMREVTGRHRLAPGHYCIVPATQEPGKEAEFLLRIFSEKKVDTAELNEETFEEWWLQPSAEDKQQAKQEKMLSAAFKKVAGDNSELNAYELQDLLNDIFKTEYKHGILSSDTCRSLVTLHHIQRRSMLNYEEFKKVWFRLNAWKNTFKTYDKDESGCFSAIELRDCMHDNGLFVSNRVLKCLVRRYSRRNGKIYFDDFIHCIAQFRILIGMYNYMKKGGLMTECSQDEFIIMMLGS